MCDDGELALADDTSESSVEGSGPGILDRLSRRGLLKGVAGAAAAGLLAGEWPEVAAASTQVPNAAGLNAFSMAMHVHSSFSEQSGSMDGQLMQAQRNAVDVLWWTDHDHRMLGLKYRNVVHFTSLTAEATDGKPWQWLRENTGSLTPASGGSIVGSPASPNDPIAAGSLALTAQSKLGTLAAVRYFAQSHSAGWNYHRNLYGETLTIDVLPASVAPGGYLELLISTSSHPATHGRPSGVYTLSYRFGGSAAPGRTSQGISGVINVVAPAGKWTTVRLTPTEDIAALWPDLASTDFASDGIRLGAVSTGGLTKGNFDYLRFTRAFATGDIPLQTQQQLISRYDAAYPSVTQHQGLEISEFLPHLNRFGGTLHMPDYTGVTPGTWQSWLAKQVGIVHAAGGLVSYNHPYGYTGGPALPAAKQDALLNSVATTLLRNTALGCDIIEVGYTLRAGVDLNHHVALWDVLSRNGKFLTGNGTTDDHFGTNWTGIHNNWVTSAWAGSASESNLLGALSSGRIWSASLTRFRGALDILADSFAPMGSVTVSTVAKRQLHLVATGLPTGSKLQLIRGTVDYAGTSHPVSNAAVLATFPASALASGSVDVVADNGASGFYRTQVVASDGSVIAASNPVWLLRSTPPGGIPAPRAA